NQLTSTVLTALTELQNAQRDIILAEAKGNWLQRSWRPIVMLSFTFVVLYAYFLQPAFFPNSVDVKNALPSEFWQLLNIGVGGYVIGRSAEKISTNVTKNADITFFKKKDRKDIYG
ncbi:MAG: holin family protein, partial [Bacteroidales bacterium]|nr:holin family protein [Bacteroidales bacterium]